jgi:iron complex outermembrane receptor protein
MRQHRPTQRQGKRLRQDQIGRVSDGDGCELSVWGKNLFDTTNISDVAPIADSDFNLFSMGRARVCSVYFRVRY